MHKDLSKKLDFAGAGLRGAPVSRTEVIEAETQELALRWVECLATTWTDTEGIMLSEVSQTEKDKYSMLSLICGI